MRRLRRIRLGYRMSGPKRMSARRPHAQHAQSTRLARVLTSPPVVILWAALAIGTGLAIGWAI